MTFFKNARRLFFFILAVAALSSVANARPPRACIIGIDGLRGDALEQILIQGKAPNMQKLIVRGQYAKCPRAGAASCARAHAGNDYKSDYVWKTGPGWGSVISGLDAPRHQIKNIGHKYMQVFATTTQTYPTIFAFLKAQGLRTAAAGVGAFLTSLDGKSLYPGIVDYECGAGKDGPLVKPSDTSTCNLDHRFTTNNQDADRDDKIAATAVGWINQHDIGFIMVVLDQVDAAGHSFGFDLSAEYLRAVSEADARVGRILAAIEARSNEDWLVVLTSDHGGHNQSRLISWLPGVNLGIHGTASGKDNIVPFIVSAYGDKGISMSELSAETNVRHFDSFKTVAKWFGLDGNPTVRARDGQSRIK